MVEIICTLFAVMLKFAFAVLSCVMAALVRILRVASKWFVRGAAFAYRQYCKWYDRHFEYRNRPYGEIVSI